MHPFESKCQQVILALDKLTHQAHNLHANAHIRQMFGAFMSKQLSRICIYCGSNPGAKPEYLDAARTLGEFLAQENIDIVYGGAGVGIMGAVATSAMENGGKVIGVIPEFFSDRVGHKSLTETHIVQTMHERKKLMFDLSDAFVALPGGVGTLEEILEVLTWAQIGSHSKPCGLLNIEGYFDLLLNFLDHSVEQQFVKQEHRDMLLSASTHTELLSIFRNYESVQVEKWFPRNN
jgi:uncharacterized protein (TIGR00730 family)